MELLILLALTCWGGTRYLANEPARINERRQRSTQSHELRMQRMHARQGPTLAQAISIRVAQRLAEPRGRPARTAIALWWADSWGYATDRRLGRHERWYERWEKGDLPRQRAERAVKDWLTVHWTQTKTQRQAKRAEKRGDPVHAEATVSPAPPDADDIVDAEIVDPDESVRKTPRSPKGEDLNGTRVTDDGAASESAERTTSENEETETPPPSPRRSPEDTVDSTVDSTVPAAQGPDEPTGRAEQGHLNQPEDRMASVHAIRRDVPPMTETSTITSGETLDPHAGHAFVSGIAGVAAQIGQQIEESIAALRREKVGGEILTDLTALGELASHMHTTSSRAAEKFAGHITTQDQVQSNPDLAGTVQGTYLGRG
jgi:hypothetical protein